jgi:hypothetical protein
MIVNTNPIQIKGTDVLIENSIVIGYSFKGLVDKVETTGIEFRIGFYETVEKWLETTSNTIKVQGFDNPKDLLKIEYDLTSSQGIGYAFDLALKDYLLQVFPSWDESKLVITSNPIVE